MCHCCLSDQRYNFLKANHNSRPRWNSSGPVVYQIKDTIFWKQITTFVLMIAGFGGCLSDQRYNFLKANHNEVHVELHLFRLFIRSKIQFFESKSQRRRNRKTVTSCCLSDQRYNFLKAIHNKFCKSISYIALRNGLEPLYAKEVLFLRL